MRSAITGTATLRKRSPLIGTLIGVRLQPDALNALDVWRRQQADPPSRPEAIRRLLRAALAEL